MSEILVQTIINTTYHLASVSKHSATCLTLYNVGVRLYPGCNGLAVSGLIRWPLLLKE